MQNGSLIRAARQRGPDVWEFRWRERAGSGEQTHRRIVIGSVHRLVDEAAARQAISGTGAQNASRQRLHDSACRRTREYRNQRTLLQHRCCTDSRPHPQHSLLR